MANRRFIDFPVATTVGANDIILIWQDGLNKQTTKATILSGLPEDLEDLADVNISGLTNGQILRYDSTTGKWENTDQGNLDLNDLNDVSIVSPSNGQVLVYNSSTSKWENSSGGFVPYTGAVTTVNLGAQTIQAGSFVKQGGTSAQFLKADGSVDSTAYGTGSVTSVGLTMPSAFNVGSSPITTNGTLAVTGAGTTAQYVRGDGSLATFPGLTGFVPYTGATADVNLGTHDLTAERGTFQNNGSSDTLTVNHTSGSGKGINVSKGGNGEALLVTKTSGSGNAMAVVGGRTALVDLSLSSVSNATGNFLTISGGVVHQRTPSETRSDVGAQAQLNGTGFVKASGTTITYDNSTYQVTSEKAQPNGYASLDSNGKVPLVQINDALIGNVNFQGLWNASTNTPTLANPPASGTKGYYYIVSTAGTFAGISFEVGDWIISNGTAWGKVDNTDAVSSVFGRTGNVTASNGDYNTSQVTENTNLYFTNARAIASVLTGYTSGAGTISAADSILSAIQKLNGNIGALTTGVSSVNGQTGVVVLTTTNIAEGTNLYYTEARVNANTNVAANTAARHAAVTLGTANGLSLSTQQLSLGLASAGVTGALSGTDWSTFNSKQNALTNPVTGTGTTNYLPKFSGASTITNSQVFDNGTNVGINTATPATKLHIVASSAITSSTLLRIDGGSNDFAGGNDANVSQSIDFFGCFFNGSFIGQAVGASISMQKNGSWNEVDGGEATRGSLVFSTNNGTSASPQLAERMRILPSGATTFTNNVTAASFIRSGGTSSQFLKADGSVDSNTYITGNQSITLSGDATGSGTTAITVVLANSGVASGTYNNSATQVRPFTVDAKGRITSIGTAVTITPAFSDVTGKPTTLAGYGITDAYTQTQVNTLLSGYLPLTGGTLTGALGGTSASFSGNLTVSTGNATGGGIILADDGDIVDLNDAFLSLRFSSGVRVFSANRGGSPVITLSNTGAISANGNITGANLSGTNTGDQTLSGLGGVPTSRTITINGTTQDLSDNRIYNVGTVTSVAALTIGTSGTDLSSSVANGTTTPVITLNVPTASATNRGALSAADWTTFNGKENAITAGTTAQYYRGDKTFQTLNTAAVPESGNLYYTEARVNANANVAANTAARHNAVTLGTANGLSLSTQQLSLGLASSSANGALSSTDWTTFNNKQNALTNPVTGTGTTNYLPKFTGTSTIGNSIVFDNGSVVSIGTNATLVQTLNINETYASQSLNSTSGNFAYIGLLNGATGGGFNLAVEGSSGGTFGTGTTAYAGVLSRLGAYNLQFATNNVVRATIDPSGNLGIGSTTPSVRLHVQNSSVENPSLFILEGSNTGRGLEIKLGADGLGANGSAVIYNTRVGSPYGEHIWQQAGTQRMRLDTSGNLGLGVTPSAWISSAKAFQVGNTAALFAPTSEAILGNNIFVNSSDSNIYLTSNFATQYRQVNGLHIWYTAPSGTAGNAISFTQSMTLGSNSGLSIGTPSAAPAQGLLVQGEGRFNAYVNSTNQVIANNSITTPVNDTTLSNGTVYALNGISTVNNYGIGVSGIRNSNYDIWFQTGSINGGGYRFYRGTSELVTILNNGNVGIGTASPAQRLSVNGGVYVASFVGSTTPYITVGTAASGADNRLEIVYNAAGNYGTLGISGYDGIFTVKPNAIGIGTANPTAKLQVVGEYIRLVNSADSQNILLHADTSRVAVSAPNGNLAFDTANAERMRIFSDGNVSISNSPSNAGFKLDVNGTGRFSGALTGTSANFSGNVGIGTNAPSVRLQVDAASATTSATLLRLNGGDTGFSGSNDANTGYSINFDGCAFSIASGIVQRTGAQIEMLKSGSWNQADTSGGTPGNLVFKTNSGTIASPNLAERMRITSLGNVLIGTTTPNDSVLRVGGGGWFDGSLTVGDDILVRGAYNPYSATNRGNITLSGTSSNILAFTNNSSGRGYILHNGTDMELQNVSSGTMKFFVAAGESFRVLSTKGILTYADLSVGGKINGFDLTTLAPTGTSNIEWRLGRALLATSSDPEDRWIRVQLGTKIYDILAIDRGDA